MSLNTEDVNERDKVEQYIYNTPGPFDANACAAATGANIKTVRNYLNIFMNWGLVKKIRHGNQRIYVRKKITPEIKRNIRRAKMREAADWLHKNSLYVYFAGMGALHSLFACTGSLA